jgi:hypothetical protein
MVAVDCAVRKTRRSVGRRPLEGISTSLWLKRPLERPAAGANLNALLDENLRDPLSGNVVLSGVPVRLEPENA